MGIFKYRNLALGCLGFIICLFASYYMSTVLRIICLSTVLFLYLILAIYCLIKRGNKNKYLLARLTPLALLMVISFSVSLIFFTTNEMKASSLQEKEGVIEARVEEILYESSYLGTYEINIISLDGNEVNTKAIGEIQFGGLKYGDVFEAEAYISILDEKSLGFDEAKIYQDRGIFLRVEAEKHQIISNDANSIVLWLRQLKQTLCQRFFNNLNQDTASLLSALLLGNTSTLSASITRDFSRLGVSHILALSGMHLAIISAILTFLLKLLKIKGRISYILTCVGILLFTAMTGFILSCLRSALMLIIFYILKCFGKRTDTITLLFLSVTLICIVSPYSIFSMSLQLSFLAMMGCVLATRIIYSIKFLRRLPFKPLRHIVFTFITTIVVCIATIPVLCIRIGGVAILSPFLNIILVPIFNLLIYISPVYLMVCDIPYISNFLGGVCEFLCEKSIQIVSFFANFKHIVVPMSSWIQVLGIVICVVSLVLFALTHKKIRVKLIGAILCGLCFVVAGTAVLFVDRTVNTYVGAYSERTRDLVYFEENNQLSIIDMSPSTTGVANTSTALANHLGYFEIENYIITDLS
ncbi:MAG: ComEC/Rec2 family competence protein [Clostridia bacterium]|nr:ComEC/Rec2 family competence protein [Clostridia bacterium]